MNLNVLRAAQPLWLETISFVKALQLINELVLLVNYKQNSEEYLLQGCSLTENRTRTLADERETSPSHKLKGTV